MSQFSIVTAQDVVAVNFTIFPPLRTIAIIDAFEVILFPSVLIPSPCSRRHAFPRMETPRSRSRTMFLPSSPAARCSRPAESVWMAAPQIGSILHPQCRHLRQRRLPTAKLVRLRARPRGLMQRVQQNSVLRSVQFPHKAAAQKSRYRRLAHKLLLFPPLLPNGRAGNRRPRLLWAA